MKKIYNYILIFILLLTFALPVNVLANDEVEIVVSESEATSIEEAETLVVEDTNTSEIPEDESSTEAPTDELSTEAPVDETSTEVPDNETSSEQVNDEISTVDEVVEPTATTTEEEPYEDIEPISLTANSSDIEPLAYPFYLDVGPSDSQSYMYSKFPDYKALSQSCQYDYVLLYTVRDPVHCAADTGLAGGHVEEDESEQILALLKGNRAAFGVAIYNEYGVDNLSDLYVRYEIPSQLRGVDYTIAADGVEEDGVVTWTIDSTDLDSSGPLLFYIWFDVPDTLPDGPFKVFDTQEEVEAYNQEHPFYSAWYEGRKPFDNIDIIEHTHADNYLIDGYCDYCGISLISAGLFNLYNGDGNDGGAKWNIWQGNIVRTSIIPTGENNKSFGIYILAEATMILVIFLIPSFRKKKRILSLILTLSLTLSFAFPFSVFATTGQNDNYDNEIATVSSLDSDSNFSVEMSYKVGDGEFRPVSEQQIVEDGSEKFNSETGNYDFTGTTVTFAYKITNTSGKIFVRDIQAPRSNTFEILNVGRYGIPETNIDFEIYIAGKHNFIQLPTKCADAKVKDIKVNGVAANMEDVPSELPDNVLVNGKSYASYDEDGNEITLTFDKIGLNEEILLEYSIELPELEFPLREITRSPIQIKPHNGAQANIWADEEHTFSDYILVYNSTTALWENGDALNPVHSGAPLIGTMVIGQKYTNPHFKNYENLKYAAENVCEWYTYDALTCKRINSIGYSTTNSNSDIAPYVLAAGERARLGVYLLNSNYYAQKDAYVQIPLPESLWTLAESASTTDKDALFYISDNGQYNADTHTVSWLVDISTLGSYDTPYCLNTKVPYVEFTATHDIDDTAEGGYLKVEDITVDEAENEKNVDRPLHCFGCEVVTGGKSKTFKFEHAEGEHTDSYIVDGYCDWCSQQMASKGDFQGEIADTISTEQTAVEDKEMVQTGETNRNYGLYILTGAAMIAIVAFSVNFKKKRKGN